MGRLGRRGLELAVRYERARPGELVYADVKKLSKTRDGAGHRVHGNRRLQQPPKKTNAAEQQERQTGWEWVHVAIDDAMPPP